MRDRPKGAALDELPGKPQPGRSPTLAQNSPTVLRNTRETTKWHKFPCLLYEIFAGNTVARDGAGLGDLDLPIPPKGSELSVTCIRVSLPQKPPLLVRSRTWFTTCEGSRGSGRGFRSLTRQMSPNSPVTRLKRPFQSFPCGVGEGGTNLTAPFPCPRSCPSPCSHRRRRRWPTAAAAR